MGARIPLGRLGAPDDLPGLVVFLLSDMAAYVLARRCSSTAVGVPSCLSTVSACLIAEAAGTAPFWFQLYMIRDRGFMRDLLAQAHAAGCSALVFTVDMPVPGSRYRDYRSGLADASGHVGSLRRSATG